MYPLLVVSLVWLNLGLGAPSLDIAGLSDPSLGTSDLCMPGLCAASASSLILEPLP